MKRSVCAVIVTYNRKDVFKIALEHILHQSAPPDTIIIVDNNSTDGTREYIASVENRQNIRALYLDINIGYAGGIAHGMIYGMSLGDFDYFWIMDDDSYHKPDTLEQLVMYMEQSPYGILGLNGSIIRFGTKRPAPAAKLQEVDYVLIDGALIRTAVIKRIGVPDEMFFMMCEDHEYCKRMKKFGYKIGLLNIGVIDRLHLGGGGSFTKATLWRGYYQSRNHLLIIKKYFSFPDLFGYLLRQVKLLVAAALFAPDRLRRVRFRLIGIWHGIRGIGGKTLDPATMQFDGRK